MHNYGYQNNVAQGLLEVFTKPLGPKGDIFTTRTIKFLNGGHIQWIAFISGTKEFSGTGGGIYSATNRVYTENIEFFSRDYNRVGASLEFEVKDGKWHHRGKSSKGDPIYEICSPYQKVFMK